jgi:GNAT superfamily N-acetyltransferase
MKNTPKGYQVTTLAGGTREFYCRMGQFFASRQVIKELEGPMYDDKSYVWFIATQGSEIVAFSSVRFEEDKNIASFGITYVMPAHRRKGLYAHLFALKLAACQDREVREVRGLANPASCAVFERNGFTLARTAGKWSHYSLALEAVK